MKFDVLIDNNETQIIKTILFLNQSLTARFTKKFTNIFFTFFFEPASVAKPALVLLFIVLILLLVSFCSSTLLLNLLCYSQLL